MNFCELEPMQLFAVIVLGSFVGFYGPKMYYSSYLEHWKYPATPEEEWDNAAKLWFVICSSMPILFFGLAAYDALGIIDL